MQQRSADLPILAPAYVHGVWTDTDLMETMLLAPNVAHRHFSLATERALLANAESIERVATSGYAVIYEAEGSLTERLKAIARELDKRLDEHNNSPKGAKYTKARRPVSVVYEERHRSKSSALKRELEVKKMSRVQKEKLVSLQKR